MLSVQCNECKHNTGLLTCKAFPARIPQPILEGSHDHKKAYPGDGGIQFEPAE